MKRNLAITLVATVFASIPSFAGYYTATLAGDANFSALSWTPKCKTGFATNDTLRIECNANDATLTVDEALDGVYLKIDVPENVTNTVTFAAPFASAGTLSKLGAGTLVYATQTGVTNAFSAALVQGGTFKFGGGSTPSVIRVFTDCTLDVNGQYSKGTALYLSDGTTLCNTGAALTGGFDHEQFDNGVNLTTNAVVTFRADSNFGIHGHRYDYSSSALKFSDGTLKLNGGMIVKTGAADFKTTRLTVSGGGLIRISEGNWGCYGDKYGDHTITGTRLDIEEGCTFDHGFNGSNDAGAQLGDICGKGTLTATYGAITVNGTLAGTVALSGNVRLAKTATLDLSTVDGTYALPANGQIFFAEPGNIYTGRRRFTEATNLVSWASSSSSPTNSTTNVTGLYVDGNATVGTDGISLEPLTICTATASGTVNYSALAFDNTPTASSIVEITGANGATLTLDVVPTAKLVRFINSGTMTVKTSQTIPATSTLAIEKAGAGTLTFTSGATSYYMNNTGGVIISEGTMILGGFATNGNLGGTTFTIAGGATLDLNQRVPSAIVLEDGATLESSTKSQAASIPSLSLGYRATATINCPYAIWLNVKVDMNYGTIEKTGSYSLQTREDTTFYNHGTLVVKASTFANRRNLYANGLLLKLAGGAYQRGVDDSSSHYAYFRRIEGMGSIHFMYGSYAFDALYGMDGDFTFTRRSGKTPPASGGTGSVFDLQHDYTAGTALGVRYWTFPTNSLWTASGDNFECATACACADSEITASGVNCDFGQLTTEERVSLSVSGAGAKADYLVLGGDLRLVVSGDGTINFGDSSARTWTGKLDIVDKTGDNSVRVRFGTSAAGLTEEQLESITYNGYSVAINSSGYIRPKKNGLIIVFQ